MSKMLVLATNKGRGQRKKEKRQAVGTSEHVGVGAHGASNEDRLARQLVVHGYEGVVRGEGSSGALAVHQQLLHLAIHHVLLHLITACQDEWHCMTLTCSQFKLHEVHSTSLLTVMICPAANATAAESTPSFTTDQTLASLWLTKASPCARSISTTTWQTLLHSANPQHYTCGSSIEKFTSGISANMQTLILAISWLTIIHCVRGKDNRHFNTRRAH